MVRSIKSRKIRAAFLMFTALFLVAGIFYLCWKEENKPLGSLEEYVGVYGETPIVFSSGSGFYEKELFLELTAPGNLPEGAAVYYSLDGTEPTTASNRYVGPVLLGREPVQETGKVMEADPSDPSAAAGVDGAGAGAGTETIKNAENAADGNPADNEGSETSGDSDDADDASGAHYDPESIVYQTKVITVRARICLGEESTSSQYAVYAFGTGILQEQTGTAVPGTEVSELSKGGYIFCLDTDPEGLYDYERGILVGGKNLEEHDYSKYYGNYMKKGDKWVRSCHLAVFDWAGNLVAEQNIGLAVSGGMSRRLAQKSLNLGAGLPGGEEDGHFLFDIFPDLAEADCAHVGSYTHLRLRARSQVPRSFRETLVGQLAIESGYPSTSEPVPGMVYLNGSFYMLAEIESTFSNSWLAHRFDLPDTEHIEKKKGKESSVLRKLEVSDLFAADLTKEENRQALEAAVDMDNYLLYYAINILDNNLDWPRNNVQAWRYTGKYDPDRPYTDGRLRFTLYDSDKAFNPDPSLIESFGTDNFVSMMENILRGNESRFRDVMKADKYRNRLICILCDLMNTSFDTDHVLLLLQEDYANAAEECRACFTPEYMARVEEDAVLAAEAAAGYNDRIRKDLYDYFGIEEQYLLALRADSGVEITWDNMVLAPEQEYSGTYYKDIPITLTAAALPGWRFDHWEINGVPLEDTVSAGPAAPETQQENGGPAAAETQHENDAPASPAGEDLQHRMKGNSPASASGNTITIDGTLLESGVCEVRAVTVREEGERLIISEISANDTDDWIRLYNAGTTPVNLGTYCLSDDPAEPTKYRLPAATLEPGRTCRINGSKNDAGDPAEVLCHCSFMLSRNEILSLTPDRGTGLEGDSVRVPYMSQNCTYGRRNNGSTFLWFDRRND